MRSVADALRAQTAQRVLALPMTERFELALSLGDDDLDRFATASGPGLDEARRRLRAARTRGRAPSVVNAVADP